MPKEMARRYWGMSVGEGGKYVAHARRGDFVAIGWDELPNLEAWQQRPGQDQTNAWDRFRVMYKQHYPNGSVIQVGIQAGQVWTFLNAIKDGDIVVVRDPSRDKVHVAEVVGGYEFCEAPKDGCEYRHRRKVRWIQEELERKDVAEGLNSSLRSRLTVFNLDKHGQAIEELMGVVTGDNLVEVVLSRIAGLKPLQFEVFVGHLLGLAGFKVIVTQPTGDKGVDIIGALSPAGLAEITLKVQVKRIRGNVGIREILQLRGTLRGSEHGVFVTLGGFTKQAIAEAESRGEGENEIVLVDGEALVDMILQHYQELSEGYKGLLKLQKRETPLRDQFATLR